MNFLDKLQQAWRSQCNKPLDINPDLLLKTARLEQRANFWVDVLVIVVFLFVGIGMLWTAFRRGIHEGWPWLITVASDVWVVAFVLSARWRRRRERRRDTARFDESVLAHADGAMRELEDQKWLSRNTLWWYLLPIAFGCMIPPVIYFAKDHSGRPVFGSLPLLFTEGTFAVTFCFVYWVMKHGAQIGLERQRRELEALRTLRESLLNTEEPNL